MAARRWRHTATVARERPGARGGHDRLHCRRQDRGRCTTRPRTAGSPPVSSITNRYSHSATLLPCGEVLEAGGESSSGVDPHEVRALQPAHAGPGGPPRDLNTGTLGSHRHAAEGRQGPRDRRMERRHPGERRDLRPGERDVDAHVGNMTQPRYHHQATLLPNGKVLISGWLVRFNRRRSCSTPRPAPLPAPTGSTSATTAASTATLLPNGKVLVTGGWPTRVGRSCSTPWPPPLGTWTTTANLNPSRNYHAAVLLLDGRVMVTGGGRSRPPPRSSTTWDAASFPAGGPILTATTDPLVPGAPLTASGSSFAGLGEGSSGLGYMHSATNYPLVQLRRLDNESSPGSRLTPRPAGRTRASAPCRSTGSPPGRALVTVFTNGIPSARRS